MLNIIVEIFIRFRENLSGYRIVGIAVDEPGRDNESQKENKKVRT